jgi:SAM-dependent methyltransferase
LAPALHYELDPVSKTEILRKLKNASAAKQFATFAFASANACRNFAAASPVRMEQVTMAKSRVLAENWYDYPHYYDIAFQAYTQQEADFIEAACRKYCPFRACRLLEPACGTGRLITELAARDYQVTGFDVSRPGLRYLRRRLTRSRLYAEIFEAEMSNFRIGHPADAAYCAVNTLRHLLTEHAARGHLKCIARSLGPGGTYVLGLHLLPLGGDKEDSDC